MGLSGNTVIASICVVVSFALRSICVAVLVASGDTGNTSAGVCDNTVIATICGGETVFLYPQKHETTLHSFFFFFSFFLKILLCPLQEIWVALPG